MPKSRTRRKEKDPYAFYNGFNFQPNTKIKGDNCPRVFFTVYLFKCPCNTEWSEWESPLSLAEEGECCENPGCKDNGPILPYDKITGAKTSCQVPGLRVFGSFQCHKCLRNWDTAHSWANKWQKCESCKITIYPFAQDESGRPSRGSKVKHREELCEMCIGLKDNCVALRMKKRQRHRRIKTAAIPDITSSFMNLYLTKTGTNGNEE